MITIMGTLESNSDHINKMIEKVHSINADMNMIDGDIAFVDA